jgi:hypothetical protein
LNINVDSDTNTANTPARTPTAHYNYRREAAITDSDLHGESNSNDDGTT